MRSTFLRFCAGANRDWQETPLGWFVVSTHFGSYACAENIPPSAGVRHGVTLDEESTEPFNLSFSVTDDWERVRCNRRIACGMLDFEVTDLVVPAQVHGHGVAVVGTEHRGAGALNPQSAIPACDALVTATPGLLLGITVADCLPVLFHDPVHVAVGLAHSGWRGTAGAIAIRTLETMREAFGTEAAECRVAIGPGIGADGYEVDATVHSAFAPEDAAASGVFSPTRPGHWALDLTTAVVRQLQRYGVPSVNIDISPWRTHRDTDLFFSHRLRPGCPRMGAFIGLS
jgi:YfiH family protein